MTTELKIALVAVAVCCFCYLISRSAWDRGDDKRELQSRQSTSQGFTPEENCRIPWHESSQQGTWISPKKHCRAETKWRNLILSANQLNNETHCNKWKAIPGSFPQTICTFWLMLQETKWMKVNSQSWLKLTFHPSFDNDPYHCLLWHDLVCLEALKESMERNLAQGSGFAATRWQSSSKVRRFSINRSKVDPSVGDVHEQTHSEWVHACRRISQQQPNSVPLLIHYWGRSFLINEGRRALSV